MSGEQQPLFDPGPEVNPKAKKPRSTIAVSLSADVDLQESDLWPDDDAPENWTAEDALDVINACGLSALGLLDDIEVTVYVADSPDGRKFA